MLVVRGSNTSPVVSSRGITSNPINLEMKQHHQAGQNVSKQTLNIKPLQWSLWLAGSESHQGEPCEPINRNTL